MQVLRLNNLYYKKEEPVHNIQALLFYKYIVLIV